MTFPTIRRGPPEVAEPPWACDEASMLMIVLDADINKLDDLCDRLVNKPLRGKARFRTSDPSIWLTVQRINGFRSTATGSDGVRYNYGEATFWVPVVDDKGDSHFVAPYVMHEPTVPTAIGRELFGFAKELCMLKSASDGSSHEIYVLGHTGPGSTAAWTLLGQLERTGNGAIDALAGVNLLDTANRQRGLDFFTSAPLAYKAITSLHMPFLFLRQFAAPEAGGCDLQQVVRVPMVVDGSVSKMNADAQWRLTLNASLKSHQIVGDLGVPATAASTQTAKMTCRFELQAGSILA